MAAVGIFLTDGWAGFFNFGQDKGGMNSGKLGTVSSIRLDYQTDLMIKITPYSFDTIYLKHFVGESYNPYENYWTSIRYFQDDEDVVDVSSPESEALREYYEEGGDNSAKGIIGIRNVDGDRNGIYEPYYLGDIIDYNDVGYINENSENLATKGLRTLVLTQKIIQEEEYNKWNEEYEEAKASMENRQQKISEVVSKLENNMDFLCVTGVEDLLQDQVATTIDNLRNAGMKVWMLTGDKVETATCISISAGLKAKTHKIYTIKNDEIKSAASEIKEKLRIGNFEGEEITNENMEAKACAKALRNRFEEYKKKIIIDPHLFIIDGDTLDLALKNCEKDFFETAMQAPSVVCCRCSPTQKRIIVKTIKNYTEARTAAVGDGGNDVAMIQEADVGIGIVGKEGLQASLAADYSIKEFKSLNMLLLWFGRIAYKNTSMMSNFIIHRGLIIAFNQFIFSCIFYYNPIPLYSGLLTFGYSTVFTSLPCISVLLDQDVNKNNVLTFPTLYKLLLKGRELNFKSFLFWLFKSILQSTAIMFLAIAFFPENIYFKIVTVTFTALIYLEILNIYLSINKFHWFMGVSFGSTIAVYLLTIFLLKNYLDAYFLFEAETFFKIIPIALIAWLPFFIGTIIKKKFFPQTVEKINQVKNIELKNDINTDTKSD